MSGAKPMNKLRWLHRIGYVCTALIGLQLAALSFLAIETLTKVWRIDAEQRARTKTMERPLQKYSLLSEFLPTSNRSGATMIAEPSFGSYDYGLSIWPEPDHKTARGLLVRRHRDRDGVPTKLVSRAQFSFPLPVYRQAVSQIDRLAAGYPGDRRVCLDGTGIAFERRQDRRSVSGTGNVCVPHYRRVSSIFLGIAKRFGTPVVRDLEDNWMTR